MKTFFTRLLNVPANLQPGLLVMICTLLTTFSVFGQFDFSDNAGNYGGTWPNGSNFGTGYNAWAISTTGGNAGTFIGNPSTNGMGTTGIGTTAHGVFGHSGNTVNAIRYFGAGGTNVQMQIGDVFSFHWAMNWDAGGGFKGFDLREDGTTIFNVNNGGSATITTTNGNANTTYGTDAMLVTLTRISWTQYTFTMTSRSGGAPYSTTINSTANINNINIYCGNQSDNNGNRNIYFNNFNFTKAAPYETNFDVTDPRVMTGTNGLTKTGTNILTLSGANTYTGNTAINAGTVRLGAANRIADASNVTLGGGTLSTGAAAGFAETVGTLTVSANSNIAFGTGAHNLTFANSSATTWNGFLLVSGWTGSYNGTAGTAGRLFIGNTAAGLSEEQVLRVLFLNTGGVYHTATILGTGEVVPTTRVAMFWNGTGTWSTANTWSLTPGGPYNQTWVSGRTAYFLVPASTITGATTNVSGIVAFENLTFTAGGTLGTGGSVASVYVASGKLVNFGTQALSIAAGSGWRKNGPGIFQNNGSAYPGGFTLNEGLLVAGGVNAMGGAAGNSLTINGGTIGANANRTFAGKYPAGIAVNADFTLGSATTPAIQTATLLFNNNTSLGSSTTRTITLGGTATYTWNGVISGASSNLVLAATAAGTLSLGGASTYGGSTTISGGTMLLTTGANRLPTTTSLIFANTAGAVLNLNNLGQTVASLSGGGAIGGNITTGGATGVLTVNQATNTNYAGIISGTGALVKTGVGTLTLAGANTYTGLTTITNGTLQLGAAGVLANTSNMVLNGGAFSTGVTAGFAETLGTLNLNANSVINLGTGAHDINFANSSAVAWAGSTLTINGWTGTGGSSGTSGRIFFGAATGTLTAGQLAKISFTGFAGTPILLSSGELVPPVPPITFTWNGSVNSDWTNSANWTPASGPPATPASGDLVIIPDAGSYGSALSVTGAQACLNFTVNANGTYGIAAGGSLTVGGTYIYSSSTSATFDCSSTLNINGSASSTIPAANYGSLNLVGGPRVLANGGTIGICGNYTPSAGTTTVTGNTVNFNGTAAQSILSNPAVFNNLVVSNTTAAVSSGVNVSVGGTGNINASALFIQTAGTFAATAVATTVNGTLRTTGTGAVTGSAVNLVFSSTGTYDHNRDGGTIPTASWNAASTCLISGTVNTTPNGFNGQTLGNWTWDTPGLSTGTVLTTTNNPTQISGTWTISNTNNQILDFTGINRTYTCNLSISGNSRLAWNRGGATATSTITVANFTTTAVPATANSLFINNNSSGSATTTFTCTGNVEINAASGTPIVWGNTATNNTALRVGGNFTVISGSLSGGTGANNRLRFINAGTKNYSASTTVSLTSVEVDGGNLDLGTGGIALTAPINVNNGGTLTVQTGNIIGSVTNVSIASGGNVIFAGTGLANNSGNFIVNAGASLSTVNPDGISASGALGSVRASGTRTFNTGANYTFNGTVAQNTGTGFTGGATVTFNNAAGITLTSVATVSTQLNLNSGIVSLGNNNLTVSASGVGAISGASSTNYLFTNGSGQLLRAIATGANNYNFPVGDASNYTPAVLNFASNSVARNIGVRVDPSAHPSNTPSTDYANRYWVLSNSNAAGTFTYTPTFTVVNPGDLGAGAFSNMFINRWNGALWTQFDGTPNTTFSTPNFTLTAAIDQATIVNGGTNEFAIRVKNPSTDYVWNGSIDSDWDEANNWTPSGVPGTSDNVTINGTGTYTTELNITGIRSILDFTVTANGEFTMSAASSLTVGEDLTYSSSGVSVFDCSSSFVISGSAVQTIPALNYGNLNITGGSRVLASSGTVGICGTFTPGAGPFTITGSTVDFNGTGAQTINSFSYNNLSISGARTVNNVTLAAAVIDVAGAFNPTATFSTGAYVNTGNTINYNGPNGQTIAAFNYNNVSSTNNNRILQGSGTIAIAGVFTPGTGTYTTTGSTVMFNGTANQSVPSFTSTSANRSYHNLIIEGTGSFTPLRNWTGTGTNGITGTMTMNGGQFNQTTTGSGVSFFIDGNLSITNANARFNQHTGSSSTNNTYIQGNLDMQAGRLEYNSNPAGSGSGFMYLRGNLVHTGGLISTLSTAASNGVFGFDTPLSSQSITSSSGNVFFYVNAIIAAGSRTLEMLSNVTVADGNFAVGTGATLDAGNNVVTVSRSAGTRTFTLNSTSTLITARSGGVAATVSLIGGATATYNTAANYVFEGTNQNTGFTATPLINTVNSITWLGSTAIDLDRSIAVTSQFNFTNNGLFRLGNNNLTISIPGSISGAPFSVNKMFVTNGTGYLIINSSTPSSLAITYPIGEETGTTEYSPVTINLTAAPNGGVGFRVIDDAVHPQMGLATNYLNRYWNSTTTFSTYSWNGSFTYTASDVIGVESAIRLNVFDPNPPSSGWTEYPSSSASANVLNVSTGPVTGTLNNTDIAGRSNVATYYRSVASGPWATVGNWEVSTDPAFLAPAPVPAGVAPNNANSQGILIRSPHTITIGSTVWADDISIASGGTLTVGAGGNFTLTNGAAANDMVVDGALNINNTTVFQLGSNTIINGTATNTTLSFSNNGLGTATVSNGATYTHNVNGGTCLVATWQAGSLLRVQGISTSPPGLLNQTFYDVEWNATHTANVNLSAAQNFTTITNNLTILNTGSFDLRLFTATATGTTNIGGNLTVSGGTLGIANGGSANAGVFVTLNVTGNVLINGGVLSLSGSGSPNAANSTLNITGNLDITSGRLDFNTSGGGTPSVVGVMTVNLLGNLTASGAGQIRRTTNLTNRGLFRFNSLAGTQTVTAQSTSFPADIDYMVGNGTTSPDVVLASNMVINNSSRLTVRTNGTFECAGNFSLNSSTSGNGAFTLESAGTLIIGSPDGITTFGNTTGSIRTGNIAGNRVYNTAANYTYKSSTSNQVTGNGLPTSHTGILRIENTAPALSNTVTLSTTGSTGSTLQLAAGLYAIGTGQTYNISSGGTVTATGGDFAVGATGGILNFPGTGTFSGSCSPYNVYASGGVNFGTGTVTIQNGGRFRINAGGFVASNAPFYAVGSTLEYFSSGAPASAYGRGLEWSALSGRGFPHHVRMDNNTNLNPANTGAVNAAVPFQTGGDVTITSGSAIFMDWGGNNMTTALVVGGNLDLTGSLSCSGAIGGDIRVRGNWTNNGAASNFFANNRAVFFDGSSAQTLSGSNTAANPFAFFILDNAAGLTLTTNLVEVNNQLTFSNGLITIGNTNFRINGLNTTVAGAGPSRYIVTNGTGRFIRNFNNVATLFPIGPSNAVYAPATLTQGGTADNIGVRAEDAPAYVHSVNDNNQMVNIEYNINEDVAGGNNLTTSFQWPGAIEAPGFVRTNSVYHGDWTGSQYQIRVAAATTGSDPYVSTAGGFVDNLNNRAFVVGNLIGILPCLATAAAGDWNTPGTWTSGIIPPTGANVCISHAVTVSSSSPNDMNGVTINAGGTLTIAPLLNINFLNNGSLDNNSGSVQNLGSGSLTFLGNGTIGGSQAVSANNVTTNGAMTINTAPTINGTLQLNAGSFINVNSPVYTATSSLRYSTGGAYSPFNEWTGTSLTPGAGIPQNVEVAGGTTLNMPNSNRGLAGNISITNGTLNLNATSGDLHVGGDWTRNSTAFFNPNNRAVLFNGAGNQTIAVTGGGTETFSYLLTAKSGGSLILSTAPATDVTVNASSGNVLEIGNNNTIDLNGRTLALTGTSGNVNLIGGTASIIGGPGSLVSISNGTKTVIPNAGATLSFGSTVTVALNSGINFGSNTSTINGTLQIALGGFVTTNPPTYAASSVLRYFTGNAFNRGPEWSTNSGPGYPFNVVVDQNGTVTTVNLAPGSGVCQIAGNLTINNGAAVSMGAMGIPLNVRGSVVVGGALSGSLTLSSSAGGDLQVGGDFTRNTGGVLTQLGREVEMNGNGVQNIFNIGTFDLLAINNTGGSVVLSANTNINTRLRLSNGTLNMGAFTLTMANASQILRTSSAATMSAEPTLAGADQYDVRYTASLTTGNEFATNNTRVRDMIIESGATVSMGASRTFNRDLTLNASDLDLAGFTLTARGRTTAPAFSGSINVLGGGTRQITGVAGSFFDITGLGANLPNDYTKTVSTFGGTLLSFGPNVTVRIGDGSVDFGVGSPTTINGVLQILLGGSVGQILNPCVYSPTSILRFNNTVDYIVGVNDKTWAAGAIGSGLPGIPYNVEVSDVGTDLRLENIRALRGNLTINNGTFTLANTFIGSFNIGGNWTRTGAASAFIHNDRKVTFDNQTAGNQTITTGSGVAGETFYDLEVSPVSGNLIVAPSTVITVRNNLNFVTGRLNIGANQLAIGTSTTNGSITGFNDTRYVEVTSGSIRQFANTNAADYQFPMGDATNYTPFRVTLDNGGQAGAFITTNMVPTSHPNAVGSTHYLNRYWNVVPTGLDINPVYDVEFTYAAVDVVGTEATYRPVKYTNSTAVPGWISAPGSGALAIDGTAANFDLPNKTFTWENLTTFSEFTAAGDGAPLPVELLNFSAETEANTVVLNWTTASEINNDYFTIERSADAVHFSPVGIVDGAGNSTLTRNYELVDYNPLPGVSYYRLRQTDFNGEFELFGPVAVNFNSTNVTGVTLFPNPANEFSHLMINGDMSGKGWVRVTDVTGRLVAHYEITFVKGLTPFTIHTEDLAPGQYIISVETADRKIHNLPLIRR